MLGMLAAVVSLPVAAIVADAIFGQPRDGNGQFGRKRFTELVRAYRFIAYAVTLLVITHRFV